MSEPLVSVIVSSFNRPRLVRDAIDSVLAQTWPNVECVVVDDWSNEETCAVLAGYGGKIRLLKPEGDVPCAAERRWGNRCAVGINTALPHVQGDFVVFLPDDDMLTTNSIEVRARFLIDHPEATCVYGRLEACKVTGGYFCGLHMMGDEGGGQVTFRALDAAWELCIHDRDGFWSAEPIARAANTVDHGMMMVRLLPDKLPQWPVQALDTRDTGGEYFDCPDARWFYQLEMAGLGPFYSVPDVVVVKRYHAHGHRTNPAVRE